MQLQLKDVLFVILFLREVFYVGSFGNGVGSTTRRRPLLGSVVGVPIAPFGAFRLISHGTRLETLAILVTALKRASGELETYV